MLKFWTDDQLDIYIPLAAVDVLYKVLRKAIRFSRSSDVRRNPNS